MLENEATSSAEDSFATLDFHSSLSLLLGETLQRFICKMNQEIFVEKLLKRADKKGQK